MPKQRELIAEFIRERNVFDNEDSRVVIADARDTETGSTITIKGEAAEGQFRYGMVYRFFGHTFTHHRYGEQFVFAAFCVEKPASENAVVAYLQQCEGIGPSTARKLWEAFGVDAVSTLREDPERCVKEVKGLKPNVATEAADYLKRFESVERTKIDLLGLVSGRGFPRKTVENAIQRWGSSAGERLRSNPYLLMAFRGVGFLKTDKMYLDLKLPPDKLKRQALCAWHAIARDGEGHTWHPLSFAQGAIARRISGGQLRAERATELAVRGKLLAEYEYSGCPWIAEEKKARAEERCAIALDAATHEEAAWPDLSALEGHADNGPSESQLTELSKALGGVIGLLTGSPGTGKTYIAAVVIREIIRQCGDSAVAMAAPTGKAAVRLTEAMQANGIPVAAVTIHRLLIVQASTDGWSFHHAADNPLPFKYVFIDESSMLDTSLMAALLDARAPGTHYLFLGDPNQLAPVGHGAPLRDMIAAGIPCGELREIRRNSGRIVQACADIRDKRKFFPSPNGLNLEAGENLLHVETQTPKTSIEMLEKFYASVKSGEKYDPVWDVQVLCAVNKKSTLGRRPLNDLLQGLLNPGGAQAKGNRFRQGDKIINLKNGWFPSIDPFHKEANADGKVFVANGEIGEAIIVEPNRTVCRLQAPDRVISIYQGAQRAGNDSDAETDEDDKKGPSRTDDEENDDPGTGSTWDLAYAISTHKSQGSEFPVVIVMIDDHNGAQRLCTRNWIYTAISRAKLLCVTIGQRRLVDQMCGKDGLKRRTFLVERLQEMWTKPARVPDPDNFMPDDGPDAALHILDRHGITSHRGIIRIPNGILDPNLLNAADYLCDEYDYSIEWIQPVSDDVFSSIFAGVA